MHLPELVTVSVEQLMSALGLQYRWNTYKNIRNSIDQNEGGIEKFSQGASIPPALAAADGE